MEHPVNCSLDFSLEAASEASAESADKHQKASTLSSELELRILDESRFRSLRRRVEEEEEEEARVHRLDREMSLWRKEG